MTFNVNAMNERLKKFYGTNLVGLPFFRIVLSDRQFEKRIGTYTDWYGKIFIREWTGIREVPKYGWLKQRWILERWFPPSICYDPDIPATSTEGSYEPIYVYQDKDDNALEVVEEVAHKIIYNLMHPRLPGHAASQDRTAEELSLKKEIEQSVEILTDAGRSWIGHRLHSKEGIVVL